MKTLDRSRPFGIYSPPHNGAFFEQDGIKFGHDEKPLNATAAFPGVEGVDQRGQSVGDTNQEAGKEAGDNASAGSEGAASEDKTKWPWMKLRKYLMDLGWNGEGKKAEALAYAAEYGIPL